MDNPLISVVVPVYNVEAYLKECLDSLMSQTFKNFELLLVDDGSTDESGKICDSYAETDSRIRVIHRENGGLSAARNTGIENAKGEYITFVDSDDYVKDTYLQYLYDLICEYGTKVSVCCHEVLCEDGKLIPQKADFRGTFNAETAIKKMLYHDMVDTSSWAKLFHKSMFDDIRFPHGKVFEDIATTYLYFDKAGTVAFGGESQYFYRIRKNSIVNIGFSLKKFQLLENTDEMGEYVLKKYPNLEKAVLRRRVYARFSTLNQMLGVKDYKREKQDIIDFIKKHSDEVKSDPLTPKRDKIAILILKFGFPIYSLFWKLFLKIFK